MRTMLEWWPLWCSAFVVLRLGWLFRERNKASKLLAHGDAPSENDVRNGPLPEDKDLAWLVRTIRPKASAGLLQEEAILASLEDRLVGATPWLREASGGCILLALAVTFFNLNKTLPEIFSGPITAQSLRPLLVLVGANWGLIVAGLVFHLAAIAERLLCLNRFDIYRDWLERDIFPFLSVSRTTADRLAVALQSFSGTVREIKEALYPLSGLATAMQDFQDGLIGEMIPAMSRSLENVKIGLSDTAINELRLTTTESIKALREIKDHQARMLSLVAAGEARSVELATFVQSIAEQTRDAASALQDQSANLRTNSEAAGLLRSAVNESTVQVSILARSVNLLNDSALKQTNASAELLRTLSTFGLILPGISATLGEIQRLMAGVSLGLAGLAVSENTLRAEMEASRSVVQVAAAGITASIGSVATLRDRWEEAMLQMASLSDEISRRAGGFERSAEALTSAIEGVVSRLPVAETTFSSLRAQVDALIASTSEIAGGNKALVTAFNDLNSAGQKLKNLGHSITGHFNIWQEQTRNVYKKAQESTINIESSFIRIGGVVSEMEAVLRHLRETVDRAGTLSEPQVDSDLRLAPVSDNSMVDFVHQGPTVPVDGTDVAVGTR